MGTEWVLVCHGLLTALVVVSFLCGRWPIFEGTFIQRIHQFLTFGAYEYFLSLLSPNRFTLFFIQFLSFFHSFIHSCLPCGLQALRRRCVWGKVSRCCSLRRVLLLRSPQYSSAGNLSPLFISCWFPFDFDLDWLITLMWWTKNGSTAGHISGDYWHDNIFHCEVFLRLYPWILFRWNPQVLHLRATVFLLYGLRRVILSWILLDIIFSFRYTSLLAVAVGILLFLLTSFSDPGTIKAENVSQYVSAYPYDNIIYQEKECSTCKIPRWVL